MSNLCFAPKTFNKSWKFVKFRSFCLFTTRLNVCLKYKCQRIGNGACFEKCVSGVNILLEISRQHMCSTPGHHLDAANVAKSFRLVNDYPGSLLSYVVRTNGLPPPSTTDRIALLNWMIVSNTFEHFLSKKFPDEILTKCETLVPAIKALILQANKLGVSAFVCGPMAQCGSLHLLGSCFHLPILHLFVSKLKRKVKVGLSAAGDQLPTSQCAGRLPGSYSDTHTMMLGKSKAEQLNQSDYLGRQVWTVYLYSDCQCQGMRTVYEAIQLSKNSKFSTKGIIHIVLSDKELRKSSRSKYLDLAFINNAPTIKVNALDPEAVAYCMRLAAVHRNSFQSDVFVELEHPRLCDPIQMAVADTLNSLELKKPVMKNLSDSLLKDKLVTKEEVETTIRSYQEWYEQQYTSALESVSGFSSWISNKIRNPWKKSSSAPADPEEITVITEAKFDWLLKRLSEQTRCVNISRDIARELSSRLYSAQTGQISWKTAELIAFAHLLNSGVEVRLSTEGSINWDYQSLRHYVLYDMQNSSSQVPLDELFNSRFHYIESVQPQPSVLGYEVGASQRSEKNLTIWEARGPTLSNVQHILDEFVSKAGHWFSKSNLLILVPHSCLCPNVGERVFDLCWQTEEKPIESNMNVVNVTTPSNYFHLLLKQVTSSVPTVAFLPSDTDAIKSSKQEFIGNRFESYLADDERESGEEVVKVLICSGSLYHSVVQERNRRGLARLIAVPRLQQLLPFPSRAVSQDIASYRHASVYYLQEERIGKGWWTYVGGRLQKSLKNIKFNINFIGPPASIRSPKLHKDYRTTIINQALDIY